MTKKDLKTGIMVETRNGNRYVVTGIGHRVLSGIDVYTHIYLDSYDDELFLQDVEPEDYKNNDYDIMKIYNTDKWGNYICIFDREKEDVLNKKEYVISMCDNEDYKWDVIISPNNVNFGYGRSDTDTPFCISTREETDSIYLTSDGAKQLIAALQEVLDYLEKEKNK